MKISTLWLNDYLKTGLAPAALADRLTMAGVAVESLEARGKDTVLTLELTSNRPDLLSHIGVARETAALLEKKICPPKSAFAEAGEPIEKSFRLTVEDAALCPRYVGRLIRGVRVGASPAWLVERLDAVGVRSINNVVDITNFVLLEYGQPLHAFDANKISGRHILVRRAKPNETMTTLDGAERKLAAEHLLIADEARGVALAGVMGGKDSEVSGATTDVFLESASFHPISIRRTSRALGITTDSSYRFERGVDWDTVETASRRATALIVEIAGGVVAKGSLDAKGAAPKHKTVSVRVRRLEDTLGLPFSAGDVKNLLERIGLASVTISDDTVTGTAPGYRQDLEQEVDLIEEIARLTGYDKIPERRTLTVSPPRVPPELSQARRLRTAASALGCDEVLTINFVSAEANAPFRHWSKRDACALTNPPNKLENQLRVSLLPGLVAAKLANQNLEHPEISVYELSKIYLRKPDGAKQPEERRCLAILDDRGFESAKGAVETILKLEGIENSIVSPLDHPAFENGTGAEIRTPEGTLGVLGVLSAKLRDAYGLRKSPALAEIDCDILLSRPSTVKRFAELPRFPRAARDIAVVVNDAVSWNAIRGTVSGLAIPILESVSFFDLYRGKQIEPGKKSVAFSLVYRSNERTLSDKEVDEAQKKIVETLAARFGAKLRM